MTRSPRFLFALVLGTSMLGGCSCMPQHKDNAALAACEETARQSGLAAYGENAFSGEGIPHFAGSGLRVLDPVASFLVFQPLLVLLPGSPFEWHPEGYPQPEGFLENFFDEPAPNARYGVTVNRCLRASAHG